MASYIAKIYHDGSTPSHCRMDANDRREAIKKAREYAKRIGVKPLRINAVRQRLGASWRLPR